MELRQLPPDTKIFIDTNIFLYAISNHPEHGQECNNFFDRIKDEELQGVVSLIVLNELIYKLVIGEVAENQELNPANVPRYVKENKFGGL